MNRRSADRLVSLLRSMMQLADQRAGLLVKRQVCVITAEDDDVEV